jgi:glutaredoxin
MSSKTLSALLALMLLCLGIAAHGEIYRWTDAEGRVHFGDKPQQPDKAESVTVRVNTYESVSYESVRNINSDIPERRKGQVVMYSTDWCGYCKKARDYFRSQNITFVEYDIEKNPQARRQYDALRAKGVPVILVGDKRMNGFSISGFQGIYR